MSKDDDFTGLLIGGALLLFVLGMFAGVAIDREYMKAQAVKHNAAEYDSQCGVWRWKQ